MSTKGEILLRVILALLAIVIVVIPTKTDSIETVDIPAPSTYFSMEITMSRAEARDFATKNLSLVVEEYGIDMVIDALVDNLSKEEVEGRITLNGKTSD
jgi:biopolymer transport protein ExbD